jgi:hypothetical protein
MKLKQTAAAAAACIFLASCANELLKPEAGPVYNEETNLGTEPGGDEEQTLVRDEKLMLYNMPGDIDPETMNITTPETFGRSAGAGEEGTDEDENRRAKYFIKGPVIGSSSLSAAGFVDTQFIYFTDPLEGEFTLRARVRITEKQGDSTSKGYFFGAICGEPEGDQVKFTGQSRGAGILYRTRDNDRSAPAIRPYYTNNANGWSAGPGLTSSVTSSRPEYFLNLVQPGWNQERILEVVRLQETRAASDGSSREIGYIFRIFDSKTGVLLNTSAETGETDWLEPGGTYVDTADLYEKTILGQPVYLGIALLGVSLEFSELTIWDNKEKSGPPLLQTPATKPAYVPVERTTINVYRTNSSGSFDASPLPLQAHPALPGTSRTSTVYSVTQLTYNSGNPLANYPFKLQPVFFPAYADNPVFDWIVAIPPAAGTLVLEPQDGGKWATVALSNATLVHEQDYAVIMAVSRDTGRAEWGLELRVRN